MKKFRIPLLLIMMAFLFVGCKKKEVSEINLSNPSNYEEKLFELEGGENIDIAEMFLKLKNSFGYNNVVRFVVSSILEEELNFSSNEKLQSIYQQRAEEHLNKISENEGYLVNGIFDEEIFVRELRSKGYQIACTSYGPSYTGKDLLEVNKKLLCDYTDLIEKDMKTDILLDILITHYIEDVLGETKEKLIQKKKFRQIEYIGIDNIDKTDYNTYDFLTDIFVNKQLEEGKTFKEIQDEWNEFELKEILDKYEELPTNSSMDDLIKYTFFDGKFVSKEEGLILLSRQANKSLITKQIISTVEKGELNSILVERILSDKLYDDYVVEVTPNQFYLISPYTGSSKNVSDILIKDDKYYFIKVNDVDLEDPYNYFKVKMMFSESLVNEMDVLKYYFNKYNVTFHDEDLYSINEQSINKGK